MQSKLLIWGSWAVLAAVWLFGAGFLLGREIPAHRYERLGNSNYLLDVSTGSVCNAFGSSDPFAPYGGRAVEKDANGFDLANQNPTVATPSGAKSVFGNLASTTPPCGAK